MTLTSQDIKYNGYKPNKSELVDRIIPFASKFSYFASKGYRPHIYQTTFHTATTNERLTRFRHLVAGRRGGKTISAAWEVAYYAQFPREFHKDANGTDTDRPLWIWVLTKNYKMGRPALILFREILHQCGLKYGKHYRENKGESYFQFFNDEGEETALVEFKSADDPESLRGAGLDILWMDEAAFIPNRDAWDRVSPALADKPGIVITTTTPSGKNWFYEEFWTDKALEDEEQFRVEYRSIDNPYFSEKQWIRFKNRYHPLLFKQEFMGAFDAMSGIALPGDWLAYYDDTELAEAGKLRKYIGVDPAISLADDADHFVITLIGVTEDYSQVYILKQYSDRIPFAEQVEVISQWHQVYRPEMIGIENVAYQAALIQQTQRLASLPPICPIPARGKKSDRLLAMGPLFKLGRVKVHKELRDFIDQWVSYDPSIKNPKDDALDSVEIALRTAGALLPTGEIPPDEIDDPYDLPKQAAKFFGSGRDETRYDDHLGSEW